MPGPVLLPACWGGGWFYLHRQLERVLQGGGEPVGAGVSLPNHAQLADHALRLVPGPDAASRHEPSPPATTLLSPSTRTMRLFHVQ